MVGLLETEGIEVTLSPLELEILAQYGYSIEIRMKSVESIKSQSIFAILYTTCYYVVVLGNLLFEKGTYT